MNTGHSGPVIMMWTAAMRADNQSAATIRRRTGSVRRFQRWLGRDARTARPDDITLWLATLRAPATRFAYFSDLRALWSWLILTDRADIDPTAKVRYPRQPKGSPRPVETDDLLHVLDRTRGDARDMVLLGAYEALRRREIAQVRGDDFRGGGSRLRVHGKGDTEALITVHELVAEAAGRHSGRGYWFPGRAPGQHLSSCTVATRITEAFALCGVPNITPHQLRHWCGTEMLRAGASMREVQEHLRHAAITSTEIYTRVLLDDLAVAVARLPTAARLPAS